MKLNWSGSGCGCGSGSGKGSGSRAIEVRTRVGQGAVHLVITLSEQGHMGGRGQLLPNAKRVGYTKRNQDGSDLNTVRC